MHAVVDFTLDPYDVYDRCMMFRVDTMASVMNDLIFLPISWVMPNHRIILYWLVLAVDVSLEFDPASAHLRNDSNKCQRNRTASKHWRFQNMPEGFMDSPDVTVCHQRRCTKNRKVPRPVFNQTLMMYADNFAMCWSEKWRNTWVIPRPVRCLFEMVNLSGQIN